MKSRDELLTDLFYAYFDARKNKRNTVNQMRFEINYESNVIALCDDIMYKLYEISPSICFIVNEPVKREIFAADFRDRVIHHLIYNYINPVFERQFIDDSYSCRKGKGTLFGIKRAEQFIRKCSENYTRDCYVLKLDIRGYFMNIDKRILYEQLESAIRKYWEDNRSPQLDYDLVMYLIKKTLDDNPTLNCKVRGNKANWEGLPPSKSLFTSPPFHGLPIGNLTSQLFSNIYLHPLDAFIKDELGFEYYGRYVDDFIIIHPDKEKLKQTVLQIQDFLKKELHLELHPNKIYLQHYTKGVCFLGAMLKPHRSYIINRTKKKFHHCLSYWNRRIKREPLDKAAVEKMRASINSYLGVMQHHRTYNIRRKALFEKKNLLYDYAYLTNGFKRMVLKKKIYYNL